LWWRQLLWLLLLAQQEQWEQQLQQEQWEQKLQQGQPVQQGQRVQQV
jgi:hypothetical protein